EGLLTSAGPVRQDLSAVGTGPARSEVESLRRFIFSTIDHLVEALDGLSAAQLNWRPEAASTNSLYAIAVHVLGNAEENVLGTVAGQAVSRSRDAELAARGDSWEPVCDRWRDLRARLDTAL